MQGLIFVFFSVHPRLRGELSSCASREFHSAGSSPLTRGTQRRVILNVVNHRFIPAYAGNSPEDLQASLLQSVHPRLRGELHQPFGNPADFSRFIPAYAGNSWFGWDYAHAGDGSSPLTRGTRIPFLLRATCLRFIPAYAGNSVRN